jgi:hypothetical protein
VSVINPPGPDWHDRLYRRLREALERARRDDCRDCRAEGAGFRHWANPSECPRTFSGPLPPLGGAREPHKDDL